jgi:hypothetical protein
VAVPGVLLMADAQVRYQPSPCETFSVQSVTGTGFWPSSYALPYQYYVTSDPYSYCTHVSPMLHDRTPAGVVNKRNICFSSSCPNTCVTKQLLEIVMYAAISMHCSCNDDYVMTPCCGYSVRSTRRYYCILWKKMNGCRSNSGDSA